MAIIYFNIIFTVIFFIFSFDNKRIENKALYLLLITYFMLSIVFQEGSPDYESYKLIYFGKYVRNVEPVYRYINKFFSMFLKTSFKFFWVLQGIFTCVLLTKLIDFYSDNKLLSTILFMNIYFPMKILIQMRNFISIVLFFCAGMYILKTRKKKAAVYYVLSCGTHISGSLSLLTFNTKKRYNRNLFFVFIFSILFLIIPFSKISSQILNSINISNSLIRYYVEWILNENYMGKTFFHICRIMGIILFTWYKRDCLDQKTILLFNIFLIGGIIRFVFSSSGELALRLSDTFLFSEVFLIPNVIKLYKHKLFYTFFFIAYSVLMLLLFVKNTPTFISSYVCNIF